MVSGRVEGVPVRVKIASEGPKLRPDGKLQNHRFSYGFPMIFHGFGHFRKVGVGSGGSKSFRREAEVVSPRAQVVSSRVQVVSSRVKIASGSSKSCPGGSFGESKWYPGGSRVYP